MFEFGFFRRFAYIIYINDVINYIDCAKTGLYADDTVCYRSGSNIASLNSIMSRAAIRFAEWCNLNKLTINLSKSKVMIFSNKRGNALKDLKHNIKIEINNFQLETVATYKYLGIHLDQNLDYISHIKYLKNKISQRHYLLKKVRWTIGFSEAMIIFKSSILPFFDVGDIFYIGTNLEQKKSLQTLQNKCLRTIYGRKAWPGTEEAHRRNNLLLTKERQLLHLLRYAQLKSFDRTNLRPHHLRTLRSNRRLLLLDNRVRHTKYGKSFVHKAIITWNSLDEELKKICDIYLFNTRVRSEILQNKLNFPE